MLRSFEQGIAGMQAMADGLSVVGNNLANASTSGYKASEAKFQDLYYEELNAPTSPNGQYAGTNPTQLGNGAKMVGESVDLAQGTVSYTGNPDDLAISGDGYFVLGDTKGQNQVYTRDGTFNLSSDNKLVATGGQYVMGWNVDPFTGKINNGAGVQPILINVNQISKPVESTEAAVGGNLNATSAVGNVVGLQVPTYDTLGARHDINLNFIKTGNSPSAYTYVATPANDFEKSASIDSCTFQPSADIASKLMKGNYTFSTTPSATPGSVDITVTDPSGSTVLSKTIADNDQTVSLDDGTDQWFTIDYKSGGAPSTATFQVAEVGTLGYNASGQLTSMTGSGPNGTAKLDFTPITTGQPMSVNVDFSSMTGVAADDKVSVTQSDGFPAATLTGYSIGNGGVITGTFSDGSVKNIGQIAVATFSNPSGLIADGNNLYSVSADSGNPSIGPSGIGDKGVIQANSLESSNVDTTKELTELMFYEKAYTANSKTLTISGEVLDTSINLIR